MVEGEMDHDERAAPEEAEPVNSDVSSDAEESMLDSSSAEIEEPIEDVGERRAFKIIHPSRRSRRADRPRKRRREGADSGVRFRALPLLGAVLGLSSFMLPWDTFPAIHRETFHRLGDYVVYYPSDYCLVFAVAAALVLIGSILLFATSIGGIVQLSGLVLFVAGIPEGQYVHLGIGFVTCLVGAVFGCGSLVLRTPFAIPSRFLTFLPDQGTRQGLRVSVTSIGCFALGTVAIFMAWLVSRFSWNYDWLIPRSGYESVYSLLNLAMGSDHSMMLVVGASLFIIGSLVVLLSPLGSIAQGVGMVAVFVEIQPMLYEVNSRTYGGYTITSFLGPGLLVGLVAVALGVLSMVYPLRVRLPTRSLAVFRQGVTDHVPKDMAETLSDARSTAKSLVRRMMPALLILVIVLSSAVSVAALAYTQKWSSIEVWVDFCIPPEEEVEVAIQVDGAEIFRDIAPWASTCIADSKVRAGTHRITLDYCYLSADPEGIDGVLDWSTHCAVRPFQTTRVPVLIGSYYNDLISVDVECSPLENGTEVVFGDFVWGSIWPPRVSWQDITLTLTDGDSFVSWSLVEADLDDGVVTEKDYGNRSLGETEISCSITDLYGNGCVNNGDFVTLSATNGTLFSPDITYTLLVLHDPQSSLIGECELVFE